MNTIIYTIRLASALRTYNLTHQVHDVMIAVLHLQEEREFATIPSACVALSCTYQNVVQHLIKNPTLFEIETAAVPRRIRLTAEAVDLLGKVKARIKRTADPPAENSTATAEDSTGTSPTT